MKLVLRVIPFVLVAVIFFFGGSVYDELFNSWHRPVDLTISNKSGQPVKTIKVSYSGMHTKGVITIEPQSTEKDIVIRFFQTGEGSLTIEAELDNGALIKRSEGYIESGYSIYKVLTTTEITNR